MFFLARSAFCIGLVAYMLPASHGQESWGGMAQSVKSVAVDRLQSLCTAAPGECAGAALVTLGLPGDLSAPRPTSATPASVSTLQPSDFSPAWRGPAQRS